jgi:hypothetical protein
MPNARDRITIAGTLFHQNPGTNPTSVPLRCTRPLLSSEQVYARTPPDGASLEWNSLDLGWIKKCSLLFLRNDEKLDPKDAEEWERKSLLLGWKEKHLSAETLLPLRVPPGMVSLLYPSAETDLLVRSGGAKSVKYTLFALPS